MSSPRLRSSATEQAKNRKQHSGRDRHADDIVNKGEEQILTDVAHRRFAQSSRFQNAGKIAFQQRNVGGFDGNIGAGCECDSDIGPQV